MNLKDILGLENGALNVDSLITRKEIHGVSDDRISIITKELRDGFNFIKDYPRSVTIFGGTKFTEGHPYYEKAQRLGDRIVKDLKYSVFTGGGPGIMEAANRGAYNAGGPSLGLTIKLPDEQITNSYVNRHINFNHFFTRKVCLSFSAEAYVFFPGGFGTLDEFFEIITLIQTKKIEKVPIILVGSDFWSRLDMFIKEELLSRKAINKEDTDLYLITDDEDKIIDIIKNSPINYTK